MIHRHATAQKLASQRLSRIPASRVQLNNPPSTGGPERIMRTGAGTGAGIFAADGKLLSRCRTVLMIVDGESDL